MSEELSPPARLIAAARAFNVGDYFEAHEILEAGLEELPNESWDLFIGLIQIAVGYHKITQRLERGAARMLKIGLNKVAGYPSGAGSVNLEPLRRRVRADITLLDSGEFDRQAFARQPPRLQPLPGRATRR